MKSADLALYSTLGVAAIGCLVFLPQTNAFVTKITTRLNKSARGMTRLPDGMPVMPNNTVKYTQVPKAGSVFTVSSSGPYGKMIFLLNSLLTNRSQGNDNP